MVLALARLHAQRGDRDRAAWFYRRALTSMPPDSAPRILYEIGLLEEDRDRCETAIDYFRGSREQAERARDRAWTTLLGEARWHIGNCAFRLAQRAREEGRASEALGWFGTTLELGEPENLLDQAWFDRGEILYGIGRFDEALAAYRKVLERNPSRTGQLVERARQRIDDIRFGTAPLRDSIP
jgi:tetratricopeptide (TPR) repeat protein